MEETIHKILEADHGELDELMEAAMSVIMSADKVRAFTNLDLFWARLAMHIRAEHLRLFPVARRVAAASGRADVPDVLAELRHDHDFFMRELARSVKAMRLVFYFGNEAATFGVVSGILDEVRQRLAVHNRIEEERIYTLANDSFLRPTEVDDLAQAIRKELDNYPERFTRGEANAT